MRRVRQRIATSASHGFFARAPTSSSSHGASGTFSPPGADPFYPPQDTGNAHLGQGTAGQGQALGQLVPGGSVGPGASGVAGGCSRTRPLLRRAPRRMRQGQGTQGQSGAPAALGSGAQLPAGGAAGAAQGQRQGTGGAEGTPSLPSGAPSQKAGKEVSEQSRHLAQKILDAIDYMASPGAPNASPGGAGPAALAGGSGGGKKRLRLGEGDLSERVKRSMAAAEQPLWTPWPSRRAVLACRERQLARGRRQLARPRRARGRQPRSPGSGSDLRCARRCATNGPKFFSVFFCCGHTLSFSVRPLDVFPVYLGWAIAPLLHVLVRCMLVVPPASLLFFCAPATLPLCTSQDDETDTTEPPCRWPQHHPLLLPPPLGGRLRHTPGRRTDAQAPAAGLWCATHRIPSLSSSRGGGSSRGRGRGDRRVRGEAAGGGLGGLLLPSNPQTSAGSSGAGAGTGTSRGDVPGAGGGTGGEGGARVGAPGGFSFGGQPGKVSEGGVSFKPVSSDARPDAATTPQQSQAPSFSFSPSPGSGSKPAGGHLCSSPAHLDRTPLAQVQAQAHQGLPQPQGQGQGVEGGAEAGAFRVPGGNSGGVSGSSPAGGITGAVGSDGVSTMAGLSSSSASGAFCTGPGGPSFRGHRQGVQFLGPVRGCTGARQRQEWQPRDG